MRSFLAVVLTVRESGEHGAEVLTVREAAGGCGRVVRDLPSGALPGGDFAFRFLF